MLRGLSCSVPMNTVPLVFVLSSSGKLGLVKTCIGYIVSVFTLIDVTFKSHNVLDVMDPTNIIDV
jgi:hypothetical protein